MKANELRIGNLFQDNNENLLRVSGLGIDKIDYFVIDRDKFPLPDGWKAEPIPITESKLLEWNFEKLTSKSRGFKQDSYSYRGGISLIVNFDGHRLSVNFWQGNEKKYVHEFQNFFFELTGEELEQM